MQLGRVGRRRLRHSWRHQVPAGIGEYQVGPLRLSELPQIAAIERLVFPEPLSGWALYRKWLQPGVVYLAVRDGRRLAAYFGFEVRGPYAHVISNATHPDYRRQGLGRFVLTAAEPLAQALGARAFIGEVRRSNLAQQRVLTAIGWQVAATLPAFFGNGEDALVVVRCFASGSENRTPEA